MTPLASAAPWHPPVKSTRRRNVVKVVAGGVVALMAVSYLAGYVFLWSIGSNPREATPLTVARYGYYYSDRQPIRRRLLISTAAGGVMVLVLSLIHI